MQLASLATAQFGDVLILTITGEIDRSNSGELRQSILDLMTSDSDGLVIDLATTRYLDSAGLDLLFELQRRLQDRGKRFSLHVPDAAPVGRTLSVTGADALIACAESLPAAVAVAQAGHESGVPAPPDGGAETNAPG